MTKVVVEVGTNHNSSLERALQFIDVAAGIGAWGIKFQAFDTYHDLYAPGPWLDERVNRRGAFNYHWLDLLKIRASERGLKLGFTPFGYEALVKVKDYADWIKISSYQLLMLTLIEEAARTKKPLVISTGMGTFEEIYAAVSAAKKGGVERLTLLHCVSAYPTPPDQVNLKAMETLRERFPGAKVGFSCHTTDPYVVMSARALDSEMIEIHMDLDHGGLEYPGGHCFLPEDALSWPELPRVGPMSVHLGPGSLGPQECEKAELDWRHDPTDGLRPRLWKRKPSAK